MESILGLPKLKSMPPARPQGTVNHTTAQREPTPLQGRPALLAAWVGIGTSPRFRRTGGTVG